MTADREQVRDVVQYIVQRDPGLMEEYFESLETVEHLSYVDFICFCNIYYESLVLSYMEAHAEEILEEYFSMGHAG